MPTRNKCQTSSIAKVPQSYNGDPINTEMPSSFKPVTVSLIETKIPARKGCFIEASLGQEFAANDRVLFEPKLNTLQSYGLCPVESILTVK